MKTLYKLFTLALVLAATAAATNAQTFSNLTISPTGGGGSHIPYAPNGDIYLTAQSAGSKTGNFRFRVYDGSQYISDLVTFNANGNVTTQGRLRTRRDVELFVPAGSGNSSWIFHNPTNEQGILFLGHNNKGTTGWAWDYQFHQTHMWAKGISIGVSTGLLPAGYKLAVDGNILAEEVHVQNSSYWPDYVFAPTYKLASLAEVDAYIQENKHLPGVPSAAEVEANGFDLAEMNKILLEKIEELTLHTIRQQEELEALKAQVANK